MMFQQPADKILSVSNFNNFLHRYSVVSATIQRLEKGIVEIELLKSQQEQYFIDLLRFILVKKLNATNSKEVRTYYQQVIKELYVSYKKTETAFEEATSLDILEVHLANVENILGETRQQHHKLIQDKLALEEELRSLKDNLLISNPQAALQKLADGMSMAFMKFEREYPANQAHYLRLILLFVQHKISILAKGAVNRVRTPEEIRKDYYKLFGLLVMAEEKMAIEILYGNEESMPTIVDKHFQAVLIELIMGHSINVTKDIFIDSYDCKSVYVEFIQEPQFLFKQLSIAELNREEMNRYTKAVHEFNRTLLLLKNNVAQEIYEQVQRVLDEIENSLEEQSAKDKASSYKYFTTLLTTTNNAVTSNFINNDPIEVKQLKLDSFENLIVGDIEGQPDFVKQIKGAALILLGTLLMTVSVAAKVATVGLSMPISASGFFAGSAFLLQGRGLFNDGMEKGLYKKISDVAALIRAQENEPDDEFEPGSRSINHLAYYQP